MSQFCCQLSLHNCRVTRRYITGTICCSPTVTRPTSASAVFCYDRVSSPRCLICRRLMCATTASSQGRPAPLSCACATTSGSFITSSSVRFHSSSSKCTVACWHRFQPSSSNDNCSIELRYHQFDTNKIKELFFFCFAFFVSRLSGNIWTKYAPCSTTSSGLTSSTSIIWKRWPNCASSCGWR